MKQKKSIVIITPIRFWQLILAVIVVIIAVSFAFPFDLRKHFFLVTKLVEYEHSHVEIDLEHTLNTY